MNKPLFYILVNETDDVFTDKGFMRELADLISRNEVDSLLGINAEQLATLMYQPIKPLVEEAAGE